MQKINLNFYRTRRVTAWHQVGFILLLLAMALNAFLVIKAKGNSAQTNELLNEVHRIQHPQKVTLTLKDDIEDPAIKNQLKEADEIVKQLNLPWSHLLKTLEDTRDSEVDLLAVTPNTQTGEVLIIGQAENLKLTFEYIERLKKSGIFSKVELNDHQKIMLNGTPALRFTVAANWIASHE